MQLTRRSLIRAAGLAVASPAVKGLSPARALAQAKPAAGEWRHGISMFGELHYPAGFKHFGYVNPLAPKSGVVRQIAYGTYDNFNLVIAGLKGRLASGIGLVIQSLMSASLDEESEYYGLIAEAVTYPEDFSFVIYRLRREARWHDGMPITPADVIFSFHAFKANNPQQAAYYRHVAKAEQTGEREVTFTFDGPGNRELPLIVGQLDVLPKHWWEGTDKAGKKRDITATTLEPPLGSDLYRIKDFEPGRSVVYERVKDAWAKDLNVMIGHHNFDEIQYQYYRDFTVGREALKADQVDWHSEPSAKDWATAYDFPARREKRVVLEEFPIKNVGDFQGFIFNTRRDKFTDPRLRRAFNFAYDFEELNKQIFFGQYHRTASYFEGTELASSGLPQVLELEMLSTMRDQVPPEVFTTVYTNPVGGSPEAVRANLREATRLLREAGYEVRNTKLVNAKTGEPLSVEILLDDPSYEKLAVFYKPSLERLGISVTLRTVDDTQYQNRLRKWDYDIITHRRFQSISPGNEQRDFWGSDAADVQGSGNYAGIKNPAVDKLIDRIIFAASRAEQIAATRALDRVLLWNFYTVPQFGYGKQRVARWDRFGHPEPLPRYAIAGFPTLWWWDAERAAKVARG